MPATFLMRYQGLCDVDEMSTGTVANYDIRIAFNVGQGDQDLCGE